MKRTRMLALLRPGSKALTWKSSLMAGVAVSSSLLFGSRAGNSGDWTHYAKQGWWDVAWEIDGDGLKICQSASLFASTLVVFNAYKSNEGTRYWLIGFKNKNW